MNFSQGTSAGTIVQSLASEMELPLFLGEGVEFQSYPDGYSFVGYAKDALTEICKANQLTWSIQNGGLSQ